MQRSLIFLGKVGIQAGPVIDTHLGPIIQASAFEVLVVDLETKRMHQVKHGIRCPAQTGNGTGVRWDLRLNEHDMQGGDGHGLP